MAQSDKARILIVDDEKMNLKALADLLRDEYAPILAKSGEQALQQALGDNPPDLILLDVVMPEMGGYEVIKALKNNDKTNNIPVIFLTALNSILDEEHGLKLGAVDYIAKPYSPPIVKMRIRNHLRIVHQYKLLDQLAHLDGLTEISNRRRFEEVFAKEWARSLRNGTPFSLAMVDVDHFKQYNDHYGHAMGDLTLQKIARTLDSVLKRPADLVARYGGEEFVILLPETDVDAARGVAERARQKILDLNIPHQYSTAGACVSVSIGLVTVLSHGQINLYATPPASVSMSIDPGMFQTNVDQQTSPQDFMAVADKNLYLAKAKGRNQIVASSLKQKF